MLALIVCVGLLIWVLVDGVGKGWKSVLKRLFFILLMPVVFLGALRWNSKVKPARDDVIGVYQVDRDFYPGKQADWQYETYELEVTETHLIVRDSRASREWRYIVHWFADPEYRWTFASEDPRHHLVAEGPAIYRERFGYYYVFRSRLYGNVFFRKKD